MDKPEQSNMVSYNMKDMLLADNKIQRLRVLSLTWRISSWNYDAKNCCRIFARMVDAQAISPKVLILLQKWAKHLVEYAPYYGIKEGKVFLVNKKPEWIVGSIWIVNYLKEIQEYQIPDGYEFNVETWGNNTDKKCHIFYTQPNKVVFYKTTINSKSYISKPVGSGTFKKIKSNIRKGLARHRSKINRQALISEIERKHEKNRKMRAKRDQIFK